MVTQPEVPTTKRHLFDPQGLPITSVLMHTYSSGYVDSVAETGDVDDWHTGDYPELTYFEADRVDHPLPERSAR